MLKIVQISNLSIHFYQGCDIFGNADAIEETPVETLYPKLPLPEERAEQFPPDEEPMDVVVDLDAGASAQAGPEESASAMTSSLPEIRTTAAEEDRPGTPPPPEEQQPGLIVSKK